MFFEELPMSYLFRALTSTGENLNRFECKMNFVFENPETNTRFPCHRDGHVSIFSWWVLFFPFAILDVSISLALISVLYVFGWVLFFFLHCGVKSHAPILGEA